MTEKCTPGRPNLEEEYAVCLYNRQAFSPVVINEVMAGNTLTLMDADGDYSDWVELYNGSLDTVDLTGWGLSDTETNPKQWVFPAVGIGPGEHLIVFLSGKNTSDPEQELHANFKANKKQDSLLLTNLRGQIVSRVEISELPSDAAYGLIPGTDTYRVLYQPTPGYSNDPAGWNAFQEILYGDMDTPVVFNEIMSNPEISDDPSAETPDWIELYNRSNASIDLTGWGLTDTTGASVRWTFPPCVLGPGEYTQSPYMRRVMIVRPCPRQACKQISRSAARVKYWCSPIRRGTYRTGAIYRTCAPGSPTSGIPMVCMRIVTSRHREPPI